MTAAPHSTILVEHVNKILSTFVPAHGRRDISLLHSAIGVKSHGRITCMRKIKYKSNFLFSFKLLIINLIEHNLSAYRLMHLLRMLKNYLLDYGVEEYVMNVFAQELFPIVDF